MTGAGIVSRVGIVASAALASWLVAAGCEVTSESSGSGGSGSSSVTGGAGGTTNGSGAGGATSAGGGTSTGGGGMLECFSFSNDVDAPLAIDGTFDATSDRWQRPHDDPPVCPATALLPDTAATVPFVAYAFCNDDTVAHTYTFEMLAQEGPSSEVALDDPYLLLYEGNGIPGDARQCLAVNDDIPDALDTSDSEITDIVVPPGGAITVVGTTFTFDPNDGTGTGYYILVVSNAD